MNHEIRTGKAPKGIERVDVPKAGGHEQVHVHFENGAVLSINGSWKHGYIELSSKMKNWLLEHGWKLPNG